MGLPVVPGTFPSDRGSQELGTLRHFLVVLGIYTYGFMNKHMYVSVYGV